MARRKVARCSLISLMALLMAIPQGILRPCCCTVAGQQELAAKSRQTGQDRHGRTQISSHATLVGSTITSTAASASRLSVDTHQTTSIQPPDTETGRTSPSLRPCCQRRMAAARHRALVASTSPSTTENQGDLASAVTTHTHGALNAPGTPASRPTECRCGAAHDSALKARIVSVSKSVDSVLEAVLDPLDSTADVIVSVCRTQSILLPIAHQALDSAQLCRWQI